MVPKIEKIDLDSCLQVTKKRAISVRFFVFLFLFSLNIKRGANGEDN